MDYSKLISNSLIYIENNISADISMEDVAERVNLSMFHFHRIFTANTGIPLKTYIRKRRLTCSALELIFTNETISSIALKYKFESQESYNRAFKKEFGLTPGFVRTKKVSVKRFLPLNYSDIYQKLNKIKNEKMQEPRIMKLEEKIVVGVRCTTTLRENCIPELWDLYRQRYQEIPNKAKEKYCLGICLPVEKEKFTGETIYSYIAGCVVGSDNEIPKGMVSHRLHKGNYATFTHKGTLDNLQDTYSFIYGVWANRTEFSLANREQLELYGESFKFGDKDSKFDILIPISDD